MRDSLNLSVFFDAVRASLFGGRLTEDQVVGMEAILEAAPSDLGLEPLAYCLATAYHETARTMQPIKEWGGEAYFRRMYDIQGGRPAKARELGNLQPGDGARFAGRGYVQLTGRKNYVRAGQALGIDLVSDPDLAMRPDIAAQIMFRGMSEGWFTGKRLADYFGPGKADPVNARRIVNGLDRADLIAGHHRKFLTALKAATSAAKEMPMPATVSPTLANAIVDAARVVAQDPATPLTPAQAPVVAREIVEHVARDPRVQHVTNNEPLYQSRVALGSIGTMLSSAFAVVAMLRNGIYDPELLSPPIVAFLGGAFALYGRFVAKKPLGS